MKLYSLKGKFLLDLRDVLGDDARERFTVEDVDLRNARLSGLSLKKLLFVGGNFDGADLTRTQIEDVIFEGTLLSDARFDGAVITRGQFYDVEAYGASFRDATLKQVSFLGTNLSQSAFQKAVLESAVFKRDNVDHPTDLTGANFSETDLGGAEFRGALYDDETQFPPGFRAEYADGLSRDS